MKALKNKNTIPSFALGEEGGMSLLQALRKLETKLKRSKCMCLGDGWACTRCSNLNRIGPLISWVKSN